VRVARTVPGARARGRRARVRARARAHARTRDVRAPARARGDAGAWLPWPPRPSPHGRQSGWATKRSRPKSGLRRSSTTPRPSWRTRGATPPRQSSPRTAPSCSEAARGWRARPAGAGHAARTRACPVASRRCGARPGREAFRTPCGRARVRGWMRARQERPPLMRGPPPRNGSLAKHVLLSNRSAAYAASTNWDKVTSCAACLAFEQ
jgi:hypothetical protein